MRLLSFIALAVGIAAPAAQAERPIPRTLPVVTSQLQAKATAIAETQVSLWKCQDQTSSARSKVGVPPWSLPRSPAYRAWVLNLWTTRLKECKAQLSEVKRQWNWQAWLPDKWRRIGVCETGLNWQHSNSSFQGAFGFAISSWDAFKLPGYPDEAWQASPWQQYQVALQIYYRYGFSGWGCRGA